MAKLPMSKQETTDVLKKLSDIAALAGLKAQVDEGGEKLVLGFDLDGGRSQLVHIRYLGLGPTDQPVVMFYSPARVIPKGFLKGISQKQALELLRLNQSLMFARFGIHETDEALLVLASMDALLDTLDSDEFKAAAMSVAVAADAYERQHGGDDF